MSKRNREVEDNARPIKKSRLDGRPNTAPATEPITSARQLRQLLTFSQDGISDLRHGIASFKVFLDQILYQHEDQEHDQRKDLLKEYLSSERPRQGEEIDHPFFSQLWQAWSFANSSNNDHLASAVCAIFALLLKTLSSSLDFTEHGVALCRTITQHQHLRLIKRCLDAPKHKEFLLSPSLRLLNELATLDGGMFVREMYKRREQTFDISTLRKCLAITKAHDPTDEEAWRKPAVRTLAVRYVLSNLKHQDEGAKTDILRQRPLCSTLFGYFKDDPPELLLDILRTTEAHVFKDTNLPRSSKASLLTEQHLHRVTELVNGHTAVNELVNAEAFRWLKAVSTIPSYGILRPCGWYPPGTTRIDMSKGFDPFAIDLGLDSVEAGADVDQQPLRNPVLANWMKSLRPHSDPQERELVLTCFKAAPELVHAYFGTSALQMEPKLTNTWMAYASFMFEVASLPVPQYLGNTDARSFAELPPRCSIIIDSIIPRPMNQKVLTRCLNQSSLLISFFAVRLLVVALTKVQRVLQTCAEASGEIARADLWQEFSRRLLETIITSVPKPKDVANLYRRLPVDDDHLLQREATARLLRLFHEVLPDLASEEAFDISTFLLPALKNEFDVGSAAYEWRALELESLLVVAQHNTAMRWYQKQGGLPHSPIAVLLSLCSSSQNAEQFRSTAQSVLEETGLLETPASDRPSLFQALLYSLKDTDNASTVWDNLDDYLARAARSPVKYLDQLDTIRQHLGCASATCSILLAVIIEQAPFVLQKPAKEKAALILWINKFLACATQTSEGDDVLADIRRQISALKKWSDEGSVVDPAFASSTSLVIAASDEPSSKDPAMVDSGLQFKLPPSEGTEHPELFRWQRKDLEMAFDDGDVDALLLCLSSDYAEVQKQARGQIDKLAHAVKSSTLDEKDQIFIVLGELLETFDSMSVARDGPLPYLLSTFAVRALHVQLDPKHLMYPKLNRFLMKAPVWRASSVSKYWLSSTALSMPTNDDSYWEELQWLLDWLIDGLRTQQDVDLLRQANSLERLMAIHGAAGSRHKQLQTTVLELVYRIASIDATTLITRAGTLSWLDTISGAVPSVLRKQIVEKCDADRVRDWTGTALSAA